MGHLSLAMAASALVVGIVASVIGGAGCGVIVGGKVMGNQLAAMMGGFFGLVAGGAGTVIALAALALIGRGA